MNKKIIENTIKFMQRVDLKGNEVGAFVECIQLLTKLANEEKENIINNEWDIKINL